MVLASPTSLSFHFNLGFTFTVWCVVLEGLLSGNLTLPQSAWPQLSSGTYARASVTFSLFPSSMPIKPIPCEWNSHVLLPGQDEDQPVLDHCWCSFCLIRLFFWSRKPFSGIFSSDSLFPNDFAFSQDLQCKGSCPLNFFPNPSNFIVHSLFFTKPEPYLFDLSP